MDYQDFYTTLICGMSCGFSISNNKTIFSFGANAFGELGHKLESENNDSIIYPPKEISSLFNIKAISCGYDHSICLDFDGNIYTIGRNLYGQLGIGENINFCSYTPLKVNLPPIEKLSCGNDFNLCLSYDNKLFSFGRNEYGQIGINSDTLVYNLPQLIDLHNIQYIQCGGEFVICYSCDNKIYSWGNNDNGQLGHNDKTNALYKKPELCKNWPQNIISIKCGAYHSLVLTKDQKVYSFGSNNYGQLGLGNSDYEGVFIYFPREIQTLENIYRIECGHFHSMCIDSNYNLWIFGGNDYGQLGLGDTDNKSIPIMNKNINDIIDISHGGCQTFVKTFNNKIYAFGDNDNNQLTKKSKIDKYLTPIQVLKDKEDIWSSIHGKSKQKSARK